MNADVGTLYNSTWVAGYFRNVAQTQALYPEPIHDGWPSHNAGWPNLTSTWIEKASVRVAPGRAGSSLSGWGHAWSRPSTPTRRCRATPPPSSRAMLPGAPTFVSSSRTSRPLAYSSSLTGIWTYDESGTAIGADNTQLKGVFPTDNGVLVTGRARSRMAVSPAANPIPVNNVPAWGASTPDGLTGIFGRLSFATNQNIPPSVRITAPLRKCHHRAGHYPGCGCDGQ